MFTDPTDRRVFVCAANSVYILCQKLGMAVSYKECEEMLPVRLLATGFVRGRIEVNPHVLDLGAHRRESGPITKKVRVEATEYGNAVNVSRVRSSSPSVMVRFDPLTDAAPCVGEITATFYPEQAVGMYRSRIDVFLDNGRRPATSCIVEAQVHSEFLVKPSALLIRQADGTGVTELQIQHFAGRSIRVMAVRSTRGTVKLAKAVHSNIGDNQTTNMEFSLSMGEDRLSRGEILVDVIVGDEQDIRTVQVPFVSVGRHSSDG